MSEVLRRLRFSRSASTAQGILQSDGSGLIQGFGVWNV